MFQKISVIVACALVVVAAALCVFTAHYASAALCSKINREITKRTEKRRIPAPEYFALSSESTITGVLFSPAMPDDITNGRQSW